MLEKPISCGAAGNFETGDVSIGHPFCIELDIATHNDVFSDTSLDHTMIRCQLS